MVTVMPAATGDNIADAVLGQIDFAHNGLNNPNATSLNSPGQMAIDFSGDTQHLYVVDTYNSRILGWNDATSFTNGQPADIEIGQPDFETTLCNSGTAGGDVDGLGADSLCLPYGVAVDNAGDLFVADTRNSRVLVYPAPFARRRAPAFAAIFVYGEASFTSKICAPTATGLCDPQGVAARFQRRPVRRRCGQQSRARIYTVGGATAQLVYGQGASGTNFTDQPLRHFGGFAARTGMCNPCRSPSTVRGICTSATTATIACSNSTLGSGQRDRRRGLRPGIAVPILPTTHVMTASAAIRRQAPTASAT